MNRRNFLKFLGMLPFVGAFSTSKSLAESASLAEERELARLGWEIVTIDTAEASEWTVNQPALYSWITVKEGEGIVFYKKYSS